LLSPSIGGKSEPRVVLTRGFRTRSILLNTFFFFSSSEISSPIAHIYNSK
jgi:hypothetical protein